RHFREGNAIRHRLTQWPRKAWRRMVEARLAADPIVQSMEPAHDFTPIFIVGMPRSGTTLLAELLSRESGVCNRGEQPWLARLAQLPDLSGAPGRAALQRAASIYAARSRQDDAMGERWFIDKQPLNFRYVDLALALFPDAKVIHCQRNPRDTALSLWMQCFLEDVQGYAYDFADIATVMRDERRLMTHWRERYPDSIRAVHYEDVVAAPQEVATSLRAWIGVSTQPDGASLARAKPINTISTASLWQARQPVNSRSIGRWKNYASAVPELLGIPGKQE
ncbi:MAG: sulfotransferase, partial [Rhodanobacteraceae bacterium]